MTTRRHLWFKAIVSCSVMHAAASFLCGDSSAFFGVVRGVTFGDNTRDICPYKNTVLNYKSYNGDEIVGHTADLDNNCERNYKKRSFLHYKNNDEDEIVADTIDSQIRLEDLPRSTMERKIQANLVNPLGTAELYIGRVAMVAAVILFSTELMTGRSLPDQIFGFLG